MKILVASFSFKNQLQEIDLRKSNEIKNIELERFNWDVNVCENEIEDKKNVNNGREYSKINKKGNVYSLSLCRGKPIYSVGYSNLNHFKIVYYNENTVNSSNVNEILYESEILNNPIYSLKLSSNSRYLVYTGLKQSISVVNLNWSLNK